LYNKLSQNIQLAPHTEHSTSGV